MKRNAQLIWVVTLALVIGFLNHDIKAQCETWNENPQKDKAEGAHSIYRQALKNENYPLAYENWAIAYEIAPAADGRRDFHYMDGVKIQKWRLNSAQTDEEKKEIQNTILTLFDQAAECYKQQAIDLPKCKGAQDCYDAKAGYVLGRKAYEMYYTFNMPRIQIFNTIEESMDLAGNQSEYIIFDPMAAAIVTLYERNEITADQARAAHGKLIEIGAWNVENNGTYSTYYEQSVSRMEAKMSQIEDDLYDCQYFKDKLLPEYQADPENGELVEHIYVKLVQKQCDTTEAIMLELKEKYLVYVEEYNKKVQAELAAKNPAYAAKLLYDEGKYKEALKKYEEALDSEEDIEKQADIHFRMASILGRKMSRYAEARQEARTAASLKEGWGQPFILIGDLYASSKCGDQWNQRLAVLAALDKYAYAKSIDEEVAAEANRRIATFSNSKPLQNEGFMRGLKEGQAVKVGCWIGETVKLRFSKG
jgi:hypothetical protein